MMGSNTAKRWVQTRLKSKKILSFAKRKKENCVTPFPSTGSFHPDGKKR